MYASDYHFGQKYSFLYLLIIVVSSTYHFVGLLKLKQQDSLWNNLSGNIYQVAYYISNNSFFFLQRWSLRYFIRNRYKQ